MVDSISFVLTSYTTVQIIITTDSESRVKTIIDNAQNIKTLYPNSDIDPITKEPLSPENNMESLIRAHLTKAIVNTTATAAEAEMNAAQQSARDEAGVDTGCTHKLKDQVAWRSLQRSTPCLFLLSISPHHHIHKPIRRHLPQPTIEWRGRRTIADRWRWR
jgi:hypothetical protein